MSQESLPAATLIGEILEAIEAGLTRPATIWQFAVIAMALALGWVGSRWLRARVAAHGETRAGRTGVAGHAVRMSTDAATRLAFPLISMVFLLGGVAVLRLSGLLSKFGQLQFSRLVFVLLGALVLIRLFVYVLRSAFANSRLIVGFERTLATAIWVLVALHLTGALGDIIAWLKAERLPIGGESLTLWSMLVGLFTVAVTLLAALWAGAAIEARLMRTETIAPNFRVVLSRVAKAALIVSAVLFGMSAVGIDLTVLSVFGGALGVGLGFGLQKIASNYVSGFIILLDHSLKMGDLITVDKYYGTVSQINTRYTVVKALDGTEAIVPNEMLVSTPVTNHSYTDSSVRAAVKVSVAYDADVEQAMAIMVEVATEQVRVLADPAPGAFLTGFGADGIDLEVGVWIGDPAQGTLGVRSAIALEIWRRFRAAGISIPFPQRDIRIVSMPSNAAPTLPSG
ncbi:MAG: mechanosensitive ion channel [Burkholderiaceae bacterium]